MIRKLNTLVEHRNSVYYPHTGMCAQPHFERLRGYGKVGNFGKDGSPGPACPRGEASGLTGAVDAVLLSQLSLRPETPGIRGTEVFKYSELRFH
jgi:hypothetical protein